MDLDAVRTFVAAADAGQFSEAADSLSIPVYPHSLIWRGDNPHPALAVLRSHLGWPGVQHAHRDQRKRTEAETRAVRADGVRRPEPPELPP